MTAAGTGPLQICNGGTLKLFYWSSRTQAPLSLGRSNLTCGQTNLGGRTRPFYQEGDNEAEVLFTRHSVHTDQLQEHTIRPPKSILSWVFATPGQLSSVLHVILLH